MARTQIKTETIVIDKGANRILAERDKLHKSFAKIGVQGSESSKSHKEAETGKPGINLVKLATIHEFGAPKAKIPQRSYIRTTMDERRAEFRQMGDKLVDSLLAQQLSAKGLLARMGIVIESAIKAKMPKTKALKASTIRSRIKKSATPLVDTGQLRASITSAAVMKGK